MPLTCWRLDYYLRGEADAASPSGRLAAKLLLRLSEVVPAWPIIDRDGKCYEQNAKEYINREWHGAGLWRLLVLSRF